MKDHSILIVDDNQDVLRSLKMFLKHEFNPIHLLDDPAKIFPFLHEKSTELILLDMNFTPGERSGKEGLEWLSKILKFDPTLPVIMLTAYADIDLAVEAIKQGAMDFIVKPWDNDKLVSTIRTGLKLSHTQKELASLRQQKKQLMGDISASTGMIWGQSPAMKYLKTITDKVAPTDTNILISGENGTGKELIAQYIHQHSNRSDKPFVKVDMGSINENMFESEMFGHVKGAFTDAKEERIGRFELADEGTLFLDEMSNLPLPLQAKMLTAIQSKTIQKVGSHLDIRFDARIIAATNKDLDEMVAKEMFRQDLLYRLRTIHIQVPPLRDRPDDMEQLARHFLERYRKKYEKPHLELSPAITEKLQSHRWPGNIRELQHTLEKAVILSDKHQLKASDIQLSAVGSIQAEMTGELNLEKLEKQAIIRALEKNRFNLSKASRELGITRPTLYKKIRTYQIDL
jgi:DNA-binding NtrC family response regulator